MESANDFIKRKNKQFKLEYDNKKLMRLKDIGRKGNFFLFRESWDFVKQSNLKEKIFVLEKLKNIKYEGNIVHSKNWKTGSIEYRIGYFIVSKIGRTKGKWIWGQFCPLVPDKDLPKIIKALKKL